MIQKLQENFLQIQEMLWLLIPMHRVLSKFCVKVKKRIPKLRQINSKKTNLHLI